MLPDYLVGWSHGFHKNVFMNLQTYWNSSIPFGVYIQSKWEKITGAGFYFCEHFPFSLIILRWKGELFHINL